MKGKLYDWAKPDKERTHKYYVMSVVDNESDSEKFEAFVSEKFMRAHLRSFAKGINSMSIEALDVIEGCLDKLGTYPEDKKTAESMMSDIKLAADVSANGGLLAQQRVSLGIIADPEPASEPADEAPASDTLGGLCDSKDDYGPVRRDVVVSSDEYARLIKTPMTTTEAANEIKLMAIELGRLRTKITHLESAVQKMTGSGLLGIEELPETHKSYKEQVAYKLNKEVDADSKYLFNQYLTFRSKHLQKLVEDFKRENPRVSVAGFKVRGAHQSYEAAAEHMRRIAREDDYMDTYVLDGGVWYPLPIRTDHAEKIIYREKELDDLLSSRLEETEAIKSKKRMAKAMM